MLRIKVLDTLLSINADDWNNLLEDDYPFYRYEFLANLEKYHCVGEKMGWLPRHILAYKNDLLVGAFILYEKHNAYGEFVFDYLWHQAYAKEQLPYYPKLVSTIPYTPIIGNRLLARTEDENKVFPYLLDAAKQLMTSSVASSLHILFNTLKQKTFLRAQNMLFRTDLQFHWYNNNYKNFADFLAALKQKKRKNIRRERKSIYAQNIRLRLLDGYSTSAEDWINFNHFYAHTFYEKSGFPTLNLDFFKAIAKQMPEQILLVLADKNERTIAGALMFRDKNTLYGRHWGAIEHIDYLHFEVCYYQGIEYCIKHKLKYFEPGAQGEHKLPRGFLPVTTYSAHYLRHQVFREAIKKFCHQEKYYIKKYMHQLAQHNPYQKN